MKLPVRKIVIAIGLAAGVALVAGVSGNAPEKPAASPRASRAAVAASHAGSVARLPLELLNRPPVAVQDTVLFAAKSWYVPPPPPPPPKPVPPPPPSAPPLPFAYLGTFQDADAGRVFFLLKGDRLYTVPAGEIIDGIYRVDGVFAGQLGLTYLPLNIQQSIFIGETS